MRARHLGLQLSLATAFVLVVGATSISIGLGTYVNVRSFLRDSIRERMLDSVRLAALTVDPVAHRALRTAADEASPAYKDTVQLLRDIRSRSKDIRFIYTFRKDELGHVVFVVDAEENSQTRSHIGDRYDSATPTMLAALDSPYRAHVEETPATDKWGTWLSSYAPILDRNGELVAVMGMDMNASRLAECENRHLGTVVGFTVLVSLLTALGGLLLARVISRPLLALAGDVARVQHLDLTSGPELDPWITEVAVMAESVHTMKNGLRSFRRYVPADLVAELIRLEKEAVLGVERRLLSVFFSDIAGFTSLAERLPPEVLAERLDQYLEGMTRIVLDERGTVDKFIGDAVMAFWGAPTDVSDHAFRACRAALACQRFVAELEHRWTGDLVTPFKTRIGLNTGEVLVGNVGYKERMSYTAIGDNVNLASRLEGLNKYYETSILVTEATVAAAGDRMVVRPIDTVAVKGKQTGVRIFELMGEKGTLDEPLVRFLEQYSEAVEHYLGRRWNRGVASFTGALKILPDDRPALILLERCREYAAHPPPDDWVGVVHMREK